MKRGFSLAVMVAIALAFAPSSLADPPPGAYTYEEAVGLGVVNPDEFARLGGAPDCPELISPYPTVLESEAVPDDAPTCYMSPEDQGLVVLVLDPGDPGFGVEGDPGYRFMGSMPAVRWQGGQAVMEVSNPSVCHPRLFCSPSHFYSRISATTPVQNGIEVGWVELNHPDDPASRGCADVNDQFVMTVTEVPPNPQRPICHTAFDLQPGTEIAVRERQYADPGENVVIMEIWDKVGHVWRQLRGWSAMRCWNADQSSNCQLRFWHEARQGGQSPQWFALNGGTDGLRMRNITIRKAPSSWPQFEPPDYRGSWTTGSAPYEMCPVFDYYRFRTFFVEPNPPCSP